MVCEVEESDAEDNAERVKTGSLGEGSNDNCSLYWVDRCRATPCLAAPS